MDELRQRIDAEMMHVMSARTELLERLCDEAIQLQCAIDVDGVELMTVQGPPDVVSELDWRTNQLMIRDRSYPGVACRLPRISKEIHD